MKFFRSPSSRSVRTRPSARLRLELLDERTLPSASPASVYGQLPLAFEANQGQAAAQVNFLSQGQRLRRVPHGPGC